MTPESVLEAMAKALAKEYTKPYKDESGKSFDQRLDIGMMYHFTAEDDCLVMQTVTPRQAAVEAMNVVGPVLDKVWEMKDLLERAIRLLGEWAQDLEDGPGPEFDAFLSEVGPLMAKLRVQEPADWDYVRRFSATPNEIHDILRSGLHPNVLKAYVDAVKAGEFEV
jgi:hypothetical protein